MRARDDARRDLMAARHRVSKLLLRQGIVYSGGTPWTKTHQRWLRTHRFEARSLQMAYDTAYETMLATLARRDRLDKAIAVMAADSTVHAGREPAGLPTRGIDADRVRAGRGDR